MTSFVHQRPHLTFLVVFILSCHVVHVYSVQYKLTATPNIVRRGQSLTITAQLINPKQPVGDVRISLAKPGEQAVAILTTRGGCRFIGSVYQTSGRVTSCDTNNHRYVFTFTSVTDDHVGSYRIQAPLQNPRESQKVVVQLRLPPTSVLISPGNQSVVAGKNVSFNCSVDKQSTLPVTFKWWRIQNGNRVAVPSGAKTTPLTDATYGIGRAKKLEWRTGRLDGGQYQCQATNEFGSKNSSTATLNIYHAADSVSLTASATTVNVGTRVTLTCTSRGGNPRPGLIIYDVTSGTAVNEPVQSSGERSLTYSKVMQKTDHGTRYRCKTKTTISGVSVITSNMVTMNVQFPPTSVSIRPGVQSVVAGQTVSFICTVHNDATLPVSFKWWRVQNGNRVNVRSGVGTTLSGGRNNRLTWTSGRLDGGQYQCQATNSAGSQYSSTATLNVYYSAESVSLTTSATTVNVGTQVTLTCTSRGGNPRPGLVIYDVTSGTAVKDMGQSSGERSLTYSKVMKKTDHGTRYRCKTKTTVSGVTIPVKTSNMVTMNVQYPPTGIEVPPSVNVDEYQTKRVTCTTLSGSNPNTQLGWSGPPEGTTAGQTVMVNPGGKYQSTMTVTGDRTRNGAEYVCSAIYLKSHFFTKTTTVNVNFAPTSVTLYDTPTSPVIEGDSRVMKCRSGSSRPAGRIIWKKRNGGTVSVVNAQPSRQIPGEYGGTVLQSEITVRATREEKNVPYWCEVEYTYSNRTRLVKKTTPNVFIVYYRVDVDITVSPNIDVIKENDDVTLTCVTSGGNPQQILNYQWTYNSEPVHDGSGRLFHLNTIRYDQGGAYSCSATNAAGTSTDNVVFDVKYKPRLNESVPHQSEVGAALRDNITLSLTVHSNPEPTDVQWRRNGTVVKKGLKERRQKTYKLQINDIKEEDINEYTCTVTNRIGSSVFHFVIRPEGPPQTPTEFRLERRSNTTLYLHWREGFSGASWQKFELEMTSPEGFRTIEVPDSAGNNQSVYYTVTGLEPQTEYKFRVRSVNNLNMDSDYTDLISARTKVNIHDINMNIFVIKRQPKDTVIISWKDMPQYIVNDYANATVRASYTVTESTDQDNVGNNNVTTEKLEKMNLTILVKPDEKYTYTITVVDNEEHAVGFYGMRIPEEGLHPAIIAVVIILLALILGAVVAVIILYRRGKLPPIGRKRVKRDRDVQGEENPVCLDTFDENELDWTNSGNKSAQSGVQLYAQVDRRKKNHQKQDDAPIYANVGQGQSARVDVVDNETIYANVGSDAASEPPLIYDNMANTTQQKEQPETYQGVDGTIYFVIMPRKHPKPFVPKPIEDRTIYAEIDLKKSKGPKK